MPRTAPPVPGHGRGALAAQKEPAMPRPAELTMHAIDVLAHARAVSVFEDPTPADLIYSALSALDDNDGFAPHHDALVGTLASVAPLELLLAAVLSHPHAQARESDCRLSDAVADLLSGTVETALEGLGVEVPS
jgi:hypothetical protein